MEKSNEIDITKIKNMLKNRESYKKQKQYRQITKTENLDEKEDAKDIISNDFTEKKEEKIYDIRDVLNKAKDKKPEKESFHSLDNTNYNILKNLKLNNENKKEYEDDDLKELINTITSTSMLNQMTDKELGLNMFDLDSTTDVKREGNDSIKSLLEQAKKYEEKKKVEQTNIDNSFYTSSLNFTKEDFEEANQYSKEKKSKKILLKIFVFIFLIAITALIIFGVYNLIK